MSPPVVPPAPPETRAMGRAALLALAANLLACGATLWILQGLPPTELEARRRMVGESPLTFRLLWLTWVPASLSYLVFAGAWSRAVRPGGLASSAVTLAAVAVSFDVLAEISYAFWLPRALSMGSPTQVVLADEWMLFLISVPANALYALSFLLLWLRSWKANMLPRGLLLGLGPFFLFAAGTTLAGLAEQWDVVRACVAPWFLLMLAWWVWLALWARRAGDPAHRG